MSPINKTAKCKSKTTQRRGAVASPSDEWHSTSTPSSQPCSEACQPTQEKFCSISNGGPLWFLKMSLNSFPSRHWARKDCCVLLSRRNLALKLSTVPGKLGRGYLAAAESSQLFAVVSAPLVLTLLKAGRGLKELCDPVSCLHPVSSKRGLRSLGV